MRWFFVVTLIAPLSIYAQAPAPTSEIADYFTDANKVKVVNRLQNKMMNGCTKPLEEAMAIVPEELNYRVKQIKSLLDDKFSKSFLENPKIKHALHKDLDAINSDSRCQQVGNVCRTRLVATSIYYFQNLRPDIVGCKEYVSKAPMTKGYDNQCEIELKYRNQSLESYGRANGGMDARGVYTDNLVQQLNATTDKIFKDVLHRTIASPTKRKAEVKDPINLNICEDVESGVVYQYPLRMNLYKDPIIQLEPNQAVITKKPKGNPCVEEKNSLYSEFVPLNFEEGRSTVGIDQITPVQNKIQEFITTHPEMIITDIAVVSNSSRTPFFSNKVVDPNSDAKNLRLARERAAFAEKALKELQGKNSSIEKMNISVSSALAGPEFTAIDLNNRFVTKQSPNYEQRVTEVYNQNKEIFQHEALIKSPADLMTEARFSNLYQAKYKPFQGFKINISGYKKESMKCSEANKGEPIKGKSGSAKATNQ